MLGKVIVALILAAVVIGLVYIVGFPIYNHWFNSRRKDAEYLQTQIDRFEKLKGN